MRSHTLRSASTVPLNSKVSDSAETHSIGALMVFSTIAVAGCGADLASKHWVFAWRGMPRPNNVWWIWDGFIGIETATNSGALFGMGQGLSWLFSLLSIAAALGILYWLLFAGGIRDRLLVVALGAIMGGILGNLYDRLALWDIPGGNGQRLPYVRDWILFQYQQYTWPNFNIADCLLVCGAALLFWHSLHTPLVGQSKKPRQIAHDTGHSK